MSSLYNGFVVRVWFVHTIVRHNIIRIYAPYTNIYIGLSVLTMSKSAAMTARSPTLPTYRTVVRPYGARVGLFVSFKRRATRHSIYTILHVFDRRRCGRPASAEIIHV